MQDTLREIREYLHQNAYRNEEHVRLSLVCRVLHALGWDVWDPREVNTEFVPNRNEDNTKVDLALFNRGDIPSVFIEVKAVGRVDQALHKIEEQVRDYNRNNTALFSIITDGQKWRFYYSQPGGEFHQKCFKHFDFLADEMESIENILTTFLTKESILGDAENEAKKYLRLSSLQKAIQDCSHEADRLTQRPPFPRKPEAVVQLLKEQWPGLTEEDAAKHLASTDVSPPNNYPTPPKPAPQLGGQVAYGSRWDARVDGLGVVHLKHTEVRVTILGDKIKGWSTAVQQAVVIALEKGQTVDSLKNQLAGFEEGRLSGGRYSQIPGHNASLRYLTAGEAYKALSQLAKILRCKMDLEITYRGKSPRAGETLKIRLSNDGTSSRV